MTQLSGISTQLGAQVSRPATIIHWNCGGGCEGLSTPIV